MKKHLSYEEISKALYASPDNEEDLTNFCKVQAHIHQCNDCKKKYTYLSKLNSIESLESYTLEQVVEALKYLNSSKNALSEYLEMVGLQLKLSPERMAKLMLKVNDSNSLMLLSLNNHKIDVINKKCSIIRHPILSMGKNSDNNKRTTDSIKCDDTDVIFELRKNNDLIIRSSKISEGQIIVLDDGTEKKYGLATRIPNTEDVFGVVFENIKTENKQYKIFVE